LSPDRPETLGITYLERPVETRALSVENSISSCDLVVTISHLPSRSHDNSMSIYEEVEIEDLDYDSASQIFTYPCPCGDTFTISLEALWDGEDIALCPSCTLRIEIIYDEEDLPQLRDDDDENDGECEGEHLKEGGDEKKEDIDEGLARITKKILTVK